jgi:hypothetical protein
MVQQSRTAGYVMVSATNERDAKNWCKNVAGKAVKIKYQQVRISK